MGVDIVHLFRADAAVGQSDGHCLGSAAAVRSGRSHVVGVAGSAVAHKLGINGSSPPEGVVQLLQEEHPRSLAQNKAAALQVKGNGGPLGILALAQSLHRRKAADGQRGHAGFRSAAKHHIGIAVADVVEGVSHRIGASGAGGHWAGTHAPEACINGHLAGSHIADGGRDVKRGHPVPALFSSPVMLRLGDGQAADAAGEDYTAPVQILLRPIPGRIGQGLPGGNHSELGKAAHTPG